MLASRAIILSSLTRAIMNCAVEIRVVTSRGHSRCAGQVPGAIVVAAASVDGAGRLLVLLKVLCFLIVTLPCTALHDLHNDEDEDQSTNDANYAEDRPHGAFSLEEALSGRFGSASRGRSIGRST